jgi:hypothetical protein
MFNSLPLKFDRQSLVLAARATAVLRGQKGPSQVWMGSRRRPSDEGAAGEVERAAGGGRRCPSKMISPVHAGAGADGGGFLPSE